jgi:hypothetical protein
MTKLEKKNHFGTFIGNSILVDFRRIEHFLGPKNFNIFYSPFSYQPDPKPIIYEKKILNNHFRRIA